MPDELACPTCGKPVVISADARPSSFPFCSTRCRHRDFGRWVDGAYVVAGEPVTAERLAGAPADRDER
jgi:endogenous inhibitor of DNA gyrase (YacG/DUF329 family)